MNRAYPIVSIVMWGTAPVALKLFLGHENIFLSLSFILFFAGLPGITKIFNRKNMNLNKLRPIFVISILTIVHYLGNFYGILFGNIILTTLIIKNSPLFQKIIYLLINGRKIGVNIYIIGLILVIGTYLSCFQYNQEIKFNLLLIIIPLISSIAWASLMVYLSKGNNNNENLSIANLFSACFVFVSSLLIGKIALHDIERIKFQQYLIYFFIGIFPTLIAPLLRARSLKTMGDKIIFLDYITPIVTISISLMIFNNNLNLLNYIGIFIVLLSILLQYFFSKRKYKYERFRISIGSNLKSVLEINVLTVSTSR